MGKEVAHEDAQLRTLRLLSNFLLSSPARGGNWTASLPSPQSIYTRVDTQKNACTAGFKERIPSEQLSSLSPWYRLLAKKQHSFTRFKQNCVMQGFYLNFNNIHGHLSLAIGKH